MKLKNFMFATMIACAFASCSEDDAVIDNGPEPAAKGTFLVVRAQDPVSGTKAAGDPQVEDAIKSLTMVVFGADNTVEAISKTAGVEGANKACSVEVSAGSKKVLMVANYDLSSISAGDTYAKIAALTCARDNETEANGFSMSSKLYDATVELNKTTFLGYNALPDGYTATNAKLETEDQTGVKLYRNVAKVVLKNVAVANKIGDFANYGNPNVTIKDVFIMNANSTANIVPADGSKHWGSTQTAATAWLAGVTYDATLATDLKFKLPNAWTNAAYYIDGVANTKIGYYNEAGETLSTSTTAFDSTPFYVYENGGSAKVNEAEKTLLVIKADVTYDTATGRETAENRYYTLAIGRTGFEKGINGVQHDGFTAPNDNFPFANRGADDNAGINGAEADRAFDVLRNLQYNVSLTIKGMGYDEIGGGDPSQYLDVQVQVVGFGQVDQNVEI